MIRFTLFLFCTLALNLSASAATSGIAGSTGQSSNCTSCHTEPVPANPFPSTGDLQFPVSVTNDTFVAGKTYSLSFVNAGEVTASGAGFNLGDSLSTSVFSATDSDTVAQSSGTEISHATGTNFDWTFNWEADEVTNSGFFQWCTMRTDGTGDTGDGAESCDTQSFTVVANMAPVADAGAAQTVNEGVMVTLDGGASTDEFSDLDYVWIQTSGPTVSLNNADTANPSFTAPNVEIGGGSVAFSLTVTEVDHDDLDDSDTVVITINNINQDPVASAGPDQTVIESSLVALDGSASNDPDVGDTLTYAWLQTSGTAVSLSSTSVASPTFTAPAVSSGGEILTFQLIVTDLAGENSSNSVNISVMNANAPPVADAGSDQIVDEGTIVTLNGSGSTDENTANLTYSWTQLDGPPSFTSRSSKSPKFTAAQVGFDGPTSLTAQLIVTDEFGLTSTDTVVVTINNINLAPTADAGSDQTVGENLTVNLNGTASSDPDLAIDDVLTYSWLQTGGTAVSLTGADTATPSFQSPNVAGAGGSATFSLTVTDRGALQSSESVTVTFTDGNISPTADAGADQTVNEGIGVSLSAAGSTDDVPGTLQYSWVQSSGPAVTLSGANAILASFTAPEVGFDGLTAVTLTLTVTDEEGLTSTDTIVVDVNNMNIAPTADAGADQTVEEGVTVNLSAAATTDPDLAVDDELSYVWSQTDGVTITLIGAATETPSFISPNVPAAGGSATLTLTVTDRGSLQSTDSIVVNFSDGNVSPVADAGADQSVTEGDTVALSGVSSSDDVPGTLQYAWTQSSGPSISLTGSTTITPFFLAPEVGFDGVNSVVMLLTVTDEEGLTSTDTVSVDVANQNNAPTADAGADQTVGEEILVSLDGSASIDPDLEVDDVLTYAWTQTGGTSVTLSGADSATATFTSPNVSSEGGSAVFVLTVTDRGSLQNTDSVVVNFTNGNTSPVADAGADQIVNEGTLVTLSGAGSTDDVPETLEYVWVQTSGPSVTLTGSDSIAPSFTAPESGFDSVNEITLTLTLTDEEDLTGTDSVTVVITNVNQPPEANAGSDQVVSEETLVSLDGTSSADPDLVVDDVLTFEWTQTSGPEVTLNGADTATPSFLAPSVSAGGESATFTLTVTDRGLLENSDSVTISFSAQPNETPFVDAGIGVEVIEQSAVTLDGSNSSDADGSIASYQWTQIAGPVIQLQQADQALASFTAPEVGDVGATLSFELLVTDDEDASASAVVDIYVRDTSGVMAPVAAVLPSSRSALVSGNVGAFATIINPSEIPLTSCTITTVTNVPVGFSFFATEPATNAIVGAADAPFDIAANAAQTFVMFFTPNESFEPIDVEFAYACSNSLATQTLTGVNTLLLSAADVATADVIALVASPSQDGVVRIPGAAGAQAFGVATANVGSAADIIARAEASGPGINVSLSICESDPITGACLASPTSEVQSTLGSGVTSTFSVFVNATGDVAFDPATSRIRVSFEEDGVVRGSTSIAVTTD